MFSNHPTVQIPQWPSFDPPYSPSDSDEPPDLADPPVDVYSSDEFRIHDFKVRRCPRTRPHDWTDCPYAHSGEKARRRDPLKFRYSPSPCPDFKKGACKRGDACELAHGVFECWLHPESYRTQPCKDGTACRRKVCFFAHTPEQLRVGSPKSTRSKGRMMMMMMASSPKSIMSPPESPEGMAVVMMMRRMRICGGDGNAGGGGLGLGFDDSLPSTPTKAGENEGFYEGLDVGWISELVK